MPRNTEFLMYAYGIALVVISGFYVRIMIKLRSVNRKLDELDHRDEP